MDLIGEGSDLDGIRQSVPNPHARGGGTAARGALFCPRLFCPRASVLAIGRSFASTLALGQNSLGQNSAPRAAVPPPRACGLGTDCRIPSRSDPSPMRSIGNHQRCASIDISSATTEHIWLSRANARSSKRSNDDKRRAAQGPPFFVRKLARNRDFALSGPTGIR